MVQVIKIFGWLSIVAAAIFAVIGIGSRSILLSALLPVAAYCLLSGALLIAFGRVVELLEELNLKIEPIHFIATQLEAKYRPLQNQAREPDEYSDAAHQDGSRVEVYRGRRVTTFPDGSVLGETLAGPKRFSSFDEFREYIGT